VPPTEIAEQLGKGTIDGAFMDYGGVGIAFKLGGTIKYSTELYAYVTSFGLGMNEDFWAKLPPDLKKLVTDTVTGKEAEVGKAWDDLDVPGKKAVIDGGGEAIKFSAAENARVRKIGTEVSEAKIKEYEAKGMPARAIYGRMRELSDRHAKTSKNFWN
jgi:TRAP-type C4-dicarboxylate transport system substrate-binding protein